MDMYVFVCITSLSMFFLYSFRLAMFRGARSGHHLWACEDDFKSTVLVDRISRLVIELTFLCRDGYSG